MLMVNEDMERLLTEPVATSPTDETAPTLSAPTEEADSSQAPDILALLDAILGVSTDG